MLTKYQNFRGYTPLLGGHQSTQVEEKPSGNLSEAFDIGYELAGDRQAKPTDVLSTDDAGMYGSNIWPREELLPGFRDTFLDYYSQILDLGRDMLRIFALALDLPEDHFDSVVKHPGSLSRLMFYPPQAVGMDEHEGIAPHTVRVHHEFFLVKHTCTDQRTGLRMLYHSFTGHCPSPPGAQQKRTMDRGQADEESLRRQHWRFLQLLVPPLLTQYTKAGRLIQNRTNGIFKSTIHRATNLTGEQRYSVPFFFGVDYDATVSVIESCVSEGNPLKYPGPVKAGEVRRSVLNHARKQTTNSRVFSMSANSSRQPMLPQGTKSRTRNWQK